MAGNSFFPDNDRGVSEAIGFMLIFSLIIVGIGLVTLYGYPLLLEQQINADARIMEKNMIVLQNDVKSLIYKNVPYKETSLKVGGGMLAVYNTSYNPTPTFIIKSAGTPLVSPFNPGQLQYESVSAQQVVAIENGAVISRPLSQPGSVMFAQPRWFTDTDPLSGKTTTVIYLIGMNSTDLMSQSGIGTVRMQLSESNYTEIQAPVAPVTVTYTPNADNDFSLAWQNYFTNTLKWQETGIGVYQLPPTDTLVIKRYDIMIKSLS